jgi:hypothetical protein
MLSMAIERNIFGRRKFLAGAAGTGLSFAAGIRPVLGKDHALARSTSHTSVPHARFIAAARVGGVDCGAIWSPEGLGEFILPARAHGATWGHDTDKCFLVGRRPGSFAAFFDSTAPDNTKLIAPLAAHRFAGHAAANEKLLLTGELHAQTAAGIIALRDLTTGAVLDSWDAGGIEPHELVFADDGARLIVALGGIAQDASVKGPAINAGRTQSAIAELDAKTGRILHRHVLLEEFSSLSMRHMACAPDGKTIAVGIQDQDFSELRPLVGLLRAGRDLEFLELPTDDPGAMRFYIGSIAIDSSGRYVAATSPKGGTIALWSLSSGAYIGRLSLADVCGLAADAEADLFWVSSGLGEVACVRASAAGLAFEARWHSDAQFDNHLTIV